MERRGMWVTLSTAALLLVGCGNDVDLTWHDPGVTEYEGTWAIQSLTLSVHDVKTTWVRNGLTHTVRGDVEVATHDDGGHFFFRYMLLADQAPVTPPTVIDYAFWIDNDQWIVENRTSFITPVVSGTHIDPMPVRYVYDAFITDDGVTLTWNGADTRNIGPTPPLRMYLARTADWDHATQGLWNVLGSSCEPFGELYVRDTKTITVDAYHVYGELVNRKYFMDDACLSEVLDADTQVTRAGLIEEQDYTVRLWTIQTEPAYLGIVPSGRYAEYSVQTLKGHQQVWTLMSCMPKTLCEADVPSQVRLQRATGWIVAE